jgi:predicted dehydrogenase
VRLSKAGMKRSTTLQGRRQFVRSVGLAGIGIPMLVTSSVAGRLPANERINLGFIGVGVQGGGHVRGFLGAADVQVVAVCDVVRERREHNQRVVEEHYAKTAKGTYQGCKSYTDFRELLARKDIDAVLIATPDHWHAIPCVLAAQAGKDIYCEKPLTLAIAQGRRIADEVRKHKVIFQTGSQQRSEFGGRFRTAVELVRNGRVGKLKTIRIGVGDPALACDLLVEATPEGTDWDFWLGPAPQRGFNEILCPKGVHRHFPAWRSYREYGGGGLADMGAHHFDIAQWALDMDQGGPIRVTPPVDPKAKNGLRFTYANGVEMYHNLFDGPRADCVFEGTEGTILVSRDSLKSLPESILKEPLGDKAYRVYPSRDHRRNWLECVRSRKETICPAEVGHRSATICHLANIGYQLRRPLQWDPAQELFVGDAEANGMVTRALREPWKLS